VSTEPIADLRAARLPAPGRYLCGLTWDGTHLWHSDQDAARIYAIDRSDGSVVRSFGCAHVRADLAYDTAMLCQIGGRPKRVVLIDPKTGEVAGSRPILPANGRVTGAEFGPEGLWLVLRGPNVVQLRAHPEMGLVREYAVPGSAPSGLTYANGLVVFGDFEAATLHVIDAGTGEHVRSVALEAQPTGITTDGERLWYCDFRGRTLRALDLADIGAHFRR
jgi:outer membrane protein assembly factor BamB